MSFDSPAYLLFLPVVVILHWLIPSRYRWMVLLLGSYVFYAGWNASLSLLILFVTGCTYFAGLLMEHTEAIHLRRSVLIGAIAACLCLLFYFKYFDLFGQTAAMILGGEWNAANIILPVGISFYTFQAISYVIDVYRRDISAEKHFGYYALFISFFPQLVAGPIERASDLLSQLRRERLFSRSDMIAGVRLLVSGFFRKIVIADLIAPYVNVVYAAEYPDGSAVLAATLLFAVQIYCDFSGYSEIAMGSARLLGIRLMRNFDRPYGAANIRDFWHRWHISLTRWFTDYVYIPMGGSRRGLARQLLATTVVFALCGLWHGASWSFVIWGLMHACFLNLYTLRSRLIPKKTLRLAEKMLTIAAVCFSWLFFRAGDMSRVTILLQRLFSVWDITAGMQLIMSVSLRGVSPEVLLILLAGCLAVLCRLPVLTRENDMHTPDVAVIGMLLAIGIAVLIRLDHGVASAFIYFQF